MNVHSMPPTGLIQTVQGCEAHCEHTISHLLMHSQDLNLRRRQLQHLRDCVSMCTLMAKYLSRNSVFSKPLAGLCATVCETCGNECARFPDVESQKCAQVCLHCARECRSFAV